MKSLTIHQRSILLMICAPAMWSIAGVFTRHLDAARDFEVTFWRSLFSALFVGAALVAQRGLAGTLAAIRGGGWRIVVSGLMWCTMFSCFMIALTRTTVANTLIMLSIAPLLTAFLSWLILKQAVARRTWLAIAAAFVGMVWMFINGISNLGPSHLIGMLIALAVPAASATNLMIIKKAGQDVDLMPAIFLGSVFSALLMLPFAMPLRASGHDVGILAMLGVFQLGLPCMLMLRATRTLSAPEVSLLSLIEVLLGPVWAWLGAGEAPGFNTVIGGGVVLSALVGNELAALRARGALASDAACRPAKPAPVLASADAG
ncbi:DMT family transporter [Noviherbaspirillum humi]|nr:DMT family transporter [Noviherbaspirillum humi]